ncbi:MAG: TIGR02117 family protein [Ferruginibacter sp.]
MPKILKKVFKYSTVSVLCFIAFILLYLLSAFCLSRITVEKETGAANEVTIFIKTNGVHTDLVLPVKNELVDWSREIRFEHTHLTDSAMLKYVAMGWGDKGFYLETPSWSDLKFSTAFNATFALGNTAIHATFYNDMVENESCRKIIISANQYKRLINYINESFLHDDAGHIKKIQTNANYGNNDAFYEANGSYSLFQTCNTWANTGLKKCGQKACLWTAFDTSIFLKYK